MRYVVILLLALACGRVLASLLALGADHLPAFLLIPAFLALTGAVAYRLMTED